EAGAIQKMDDLLLLAQGRTHWRLLFPAALKLFPELLTEATLLFERAILFQFADFFAQLLALAGRHFFKTLFGHLAHLIFLLWRQPLAPLLQFLAQFLAFRRTHVAQLLLDLGAPLRR